MRCIKPAGNNHRRPGNRPYIGHFAEHRQAEQRHPHQLAICERCQHRCVRVTKRQHHNPVPGRRRDADAGTDRDLLPSRRDPHQRHDRAQHHEADNRRIAHCRNNAVAAADPARQHQRAGPAERRQDRQDRSGMKCGRPRPHDNQHARKTDQRRDPAPFANLLAQKRDRQTRDEDRRDESGGRSLSDR